MPRSHEYLILGAGPAGLQLAYDLAKAGRDYLVLERGATPGTFFRKFPRHRVLISINKRFTGFDDHELNLRWDWNSVLCDDDRLLFKHWSPDYFPQADRMVDYLTDFAREAQLQIACGVDVKRIEKDGEEFVLTDAKGETYRCARLVVATGVSEQHLPPIPGIEHAVTYVDMSTDPKEFENKRVLVLGKANSAFETGNHLLGAASVIHLCSPNPVRLAWKSKFVGHLRSINNAFVDSYLLKAQNVLLDAHVSRIERRPDGKFAVEVMYGHANGEVEELVYDRIIAATGFRFDASIFAENCRPALAIDGRFPAQTSAYESTNVKGLYFAGTIMQMRDFKKKQSGFIHGFRYNVRALGRILGERYHGTPWPGVTVAASAHELTKLVIGRVNRSSAMFQQSGYFADAIVVEGGRARHYEDVPMDYVHDGAIGDSAHYYTVMLEFGHELIEAARDPLALERIHKNDVTRAALSPSLHPIVRRFNARRHVNTHHVIEDIESVWEEDVHVKPLEDYFRVSVERPRPGASTSPQPTISE